MGTESRNARSTFLDRMSALEIVELMNSEEVTVLRALEQSAPQIALAAERAAEAFRLGGRIVYVGSGTSGRIAAADAAEMPPTFGIESDRFIAVVSGGETASERAVEDAEDDEHAAIVAMNDLAIARPDVVIGIAASGRTPFVLSAVRQCVQKGVWTCGITNNRSTPLEAAADLGIVLETGPEVLTGSTRLKAGTAQKLALNRISTAAMVLNGKVVENLMVDLKPKNQKLKERCARIVRDLTNLTFDEAWSLLESHDWEVRKVVELKRVSSQS